MTSGRPRSDLVLTDIIQLRVVISHRVFGGVVGALGRGADRVRGHASLLLLSNGDLAGDLAGALGGALLADGVLEA